MKLDEIFNEQEMKLVPCRWSRTGWKYVEAETGNHKFFANPNRQNCHGDPEDVPTGKNQAAAVRRQQ